MYRRLKRPISTSGCGTITLTNYTRYAKKYRYITIGKVLASAIKKYLDAKRPSEDPTAFGGAASPSSLALRTRRSLVVGGSILT